MRQNLVFYSRLPGEYAPAGSKYEIKKVVVLTLICSVPVLPVTGSTLIVHTSLIK